MRLFFGRRKKQLEFHTPALPQRCVSAAGAGAWRSLARAVMQVGETQQSHPEARFSCCRMTSRASVRHACRGVGDFDVVLAFVVIQVVVRVLVQRPDGCTQHAPDGRQIGPSPLALGIPSLDVVLTEANCTRVGRASCHQLASIQSMPKSGISIGMASGSVNAPPTRLATKSGLVALTSTSLPEAPSRRSRPSRWRPSVLRSAKLLRSGVDLVVGTASNDRCRRQTHVSMAGPCCPCSSSWSKHGAAPLRVPVRWRTDRRSLQA